MRFPLATFSIAAVVVAAYFFLSGGNFYIAEGELRATALRLSAQPLGVVTHLFTHVGIMHLLGNLVPLAAFGWVAETRLRSGDVFTIFLCAGMVSAALFSIFNPSVLLVGASAGVTALMAAAVVARPRLAVVALAAVPLALAFLFFPLAAYAAETREAELKSTQQGLQANYSQLVAQNRTEEAAQVNATMTQVNKTLTVAVEGKEREKKTPTDFSVHVYGGLFGVLYVFFVRPKDFRRGIQDFEELGRGIVAAANFFGRRGSRNKKRRRQK
ncbi:MAG: rhomboid family intramembrane serine protease [Candidatus Micrarchaeota archaeon]